MKYILIYITILFNMVFSIGLQSLELPINANILASAGFGVASEYNDWLNPATLKQSDKTIVEFSANTWIPEFDVKGSYVSYQDQNQKISAFSWKIDDVEQYGETPSENPLGFFGSKMLSVNYAKRIDFKGSQFGFNIGYSYMTLLEKDDKGFKLDLGYKKKFANSYSIGISVRNIISRFNSEDKLPQLITLGSSQLISKHIPITIYFDVFHDEDKEFGTYQGFVFDNQLFDIIGGVRYYHESKELDLSFGFNITYNNINLAVATLIKEEESLSSPIFYQISYHF